MTVREERKLKTVFENQNYIDMAQFVDDKVIGTIKLIISILLHLNCYISATKDCASGIIKLLAIDSNPPRVCIPTTNTYECEIDTKLLLRNWPHFGGTWKTGHKRKRLDPALCSF